MLVSFWVLSLCCYGRFYFYFFGCVCWGFFYLSRCHFNMACVQPHSNVGSLVCAVTGVLFFFFGVCVCWDFFT